MGCCGSQPTDSRYEVTMMEKWQPEQHVTCILGASGNVGRTTISHLSAIVGQNAKIIAGSRNPDKLQESFNDTKLPGVEFVKADMGGQIEDLVKVLEGVHTCFIVTPGQVQNRAEMAIKAAKACKEANVGFTVLVSVASATKHDTIFGRQFGPLETEFWELNIDGCILRLPMFTQNALGYLGSLVKDGKIYSPLNIESRFSTVSLVDVAECYRHLAQNPQKHNNRTYTLYSDTYSNRDLLQAIKYASGQYHIEYVQVPFQAAQSAFEGFGMPEWQAAGVIEILRMVEEGDDTQVTADLSQFRKLTGKNPTSIRGWANMNEKIFKEASFSVPEAGERVEELVVNKFQSHKEEEGPVQLKNEVDLLEIGQDKQVTKSIRPQANKGGLVTDAEVSKQAEAAKNEAQQGSEAGQGFGLGIYQSGKNQGQAEAAKGSGEAALESGKATGGDALDDAGSFGLNIKKEEEEKKEKILDAFEQEDAFEYKNEKKQEAAVEVKKEEKQYDAFDEPDELEVVEKKQQKKPDAFDAFDQPDMLQVVKKEKQPDAFDAFDEPDELEVVKKVKKADDQAAAKEKGGLEISLEAKAKADAEAKLKAEAQAKQGDAFDDF